MAKPDHAHVAVRVFTADGAPGAGDDENKYFRVGDLWIDKTNQDAYVCISSAVGAAVWKKITP